MRELPKAIFITGTDTGVGKTLVTATIALFFKKKGLRVGVIKPFQTGTDLEEVLDAEFVYKVLDQDYDLDEVSPFRLKEPLSPLAAAKVEKTDIPLSSIISHTNDYILKNDITIIEGAGGLYVPILNDYLISDLAVDLGYPVVLVTKPNLGTINHTMLSIEHINNKGLDLFGVVINKMMENPDFVSVDNLELFYSEYKLPILGIIPESKSVQVECGKFENLSSNTVNSYFSKAIGGDLDINNFLLNK